MGSTDSPTPLASELEKPLENSQKGTKGKEEQDEAPKASLKTLLVRCRVPRTLLKLLTRWQRVLAFGSQFDRIIQTACFVAALATGAGE